MGRRKLADGGPMKGQIAVHLGKGLTDTEIAALVGCARSTVAYVRRLVGEPKSASRYPIHGNLLTLAEVTRLYGTTVANRAQRGVTGAALFESADRMDAEGRALLDRVHQQTGLDYELLRRRYRDGKRGKALSAPALVRLTSEELMLLQQLHELHGISLRILGERYRAGLRGDALLASKRGKYIRKPKE